jgi:translation elongation factor EF-1alpha
MVSRADVTRSFRWASRSAKLQYTLTPTETSNKHTRAVDKPLRLVISDVFRGGITNPVSISGRIDTGYLQEGDVLVSIPSKEQATVKGVVCNEEAAKWAVAGHNVTVHLSGIDPIHLRQYSPRDLSQNILTRKQSGRCPMQSYITSCAHQDVQCQAIGV